MQWIYTYFVFLGKILHLVKTVIPQGFQSSIILNPKEKLL